MNITHVLESWNNAGTERYVSDLILASKNEGINFKIIILGKITDSSSLKNLTCNVVQVKPTRAKIFILSNIIFRDKEHIYHLHLYTSIFLVSSILKMFGKKFIVTYHVPLSQWNIIHKLSWLASGYLADRKVAVSNYIRSELKKYFTTNVIFPPVWNDKNIYSKINKKSKTQKIEIVCVGRLENKQKDWLTFIDAISLLSQSTQSKINVILIGGGPDKKIIEAFIRKNNLGKVITLKGHLNKEEVFGYLEESSISVLPSKFEGFGMSAVESMTRESLTITSDFPASFDFIQHGVTGYHFKVGDSKGLSVILELVINDDKLRNKVALQGKKFSRQKFSDSLCALEYYKLYNSL